MTNSEYIKLVKEQQGLLDPLSTLTTTVSGIGDAIASAGEQRAVQNAGREDLSQYMTGDDWSDIFNYQNNRNQGFQNIQNSTEDYSNVRNNSSMANVFNMNSLQDNVNYTSPTGQVWGNTLEDMGKYAGIGATIGSFIPIPGGGTLIGAGVGALAGAASGILRGGIGSLVNNKTTKMFNNAIDRANQMQIENAYDTIKNNNTRMQRQAFMHMGAEGGSLSELNGVTKVNEGGTHGQNPYNGVQMGIAPDNLVNLVEEGELVYNDYVYSNRLKPNSKLLKNYVLPEKYEGLTYAEVAEKIQKESEDRPNDPVSKRTLDEMMGRLRDAQEEQRAKLEERRLARELDKMSTEEKAALMSSLAQPMAQQEGIDLSQPMYAKGGKIYIKPENRGKFTALKKRTGKSASWFKAHGTPAQKKMATFALNAKKWSHKHDDGGFNDVVFKDLVPPDLSRSFAQYILPIDQSYTQYLPQVLTGNAVNVAPGFGGINHSTTFAGEDINDTINISKPVTKSNDNNNTVNTDLLAQRLGESLRYMPVVGSSIAALQAATQPYDYELPNTLGRLAHRIQPYAAQFIGGYTPYNLYDVNLGDTENIGLTARAINANRGLGRATQGALNVAAINAARKTAAQRNIAGQQANEANRLATDKANLAIDQLNANIAQAYDSMNQNSNTNKINLLARAAEAADASRSAWSNMYNSTLENFFNQWGNVGRDNWNRNQMILNLKARGYDELAEMFGSDLATAIMNS